MMVQLTDWVIVNLDDIVVAVRSDRAVRIVVRGTWRQIDIDTDQEQAWSTLAAAVASSGQRES